MSTDRKGVEFFVGLFLFIGLAIIAGMVLVLGRASQGMQKNYPLTVEFPNAGGLVRGCDVLISGANVGVVQEPPRLVDEKYHVVVLLSIRKDVQIPRTSTFLIRSSGMLGDSYVDIVPPKQFTPADLAQAGETIRGSRQGGLEELTAKGGDLMDALNGDVVQRLNQSLDEISSATNKLNQRLLNEANLKNLEETFANLKNVSSSFAKTSRDLDEVVVKTGTVVDAAHATMATVDLSAGELKLALSDVRKLVSTSTKTIDSAKLLLSQASSGDGAIGALVSDRKMAEDLRALLANMRRSGVLFYKDRPLPPAETKPAKRR